MNNNKKYIYKLGIFFFLLFFFILYPQVVIAQSIQDLLNQGVLTQQDVIDFLIGTEDPDSLISVNVAGESVAATSTIQVIFLFTLIALAPTILIMLTSFTRIIIVMHFLRSALGTQQMPPNQILIGLALFLTFFIMGPIFSQVNEQAFQPYSDGTITQAQAIEYGLGPLRVFMFNNSRWEDLNLFAGLAGEEYDSLEEIPLRVLVPAFILSELTFGFTIGFLIFIPFIVIDMVVASVLMAMGMMMLPPAMISTPFKILLFVIVDGWSLLILELINTFNF